MLQASASKFVDDYFAYGSIDVDWKNIFTGLQTSDTLVIVATDNYAEATDHIIAHLQFLEVSCCSALATEIVDGTQVLVANSADLGFYKSNHSFWGKLKTHLRLGEFSTIFVVDDFGFNEVGFDIYSEPDKVKKRSLEMSEALSSVFDYVPVLFNFFVKTLNDPETSNISESYTREYKTLIAEVEKLIYK
ncbi:MAG: hypothetical protein K8L97_30115 [Anaerolineae bacterium]|nr:hypothetical protein [Anaerolineae bacterium]